MENVSNDNTLYKFDYIDLSIDDTGIYIQIQDYINCSLLKDTRSITQVISKWTLQYPTIIYSQNTSTKKIYLIYNGDSGWGEELDYDDISFINEYKRNKIPSYELQKYRLRLNLLRDINKNFNHNAESIYMLNCFKNIMNQNIDLYTDNLQIRKQDFLQQIDMSTPEDDKYTEIKIANFLAYSKNGNPQESSSSSSNEAYFNSDNFIPCYNTNLQYVTIKLESQELKKYPIKYVQVQLYKNTRTNGEEIVLQVKGKLSSPNEFKYDDNYGYKYGSIYDKKNNQILEVWSNNFEFNSNVFYIIMIFNEEQMTLLRNSYDTTSSNQSINSPFLLRCRIANQVNQNKLPIWNGWSEYIQNIKINTPPSRPAGLTFGKNTLTI